MTSPTRSFDRASLAAAIWCKLCSPPPANDVAGRSVPLSRRLPKDAVELGILCATLDLKRRSDLRAAALLVMCGLGLPKRDIVRLDRSDVVTVGAVVCVRVPDRRAHEADTFLPVIGADAHVLRAYLAQQHDGAPERGAPLFYSVERGRADRRERISASAISYWLLELRLRARRALAAGQLAPRATEGGPRRRAATPLNARRRRSRSTRAG